MKVEIDNSNSRLIFIPETDDDAQELKILSISLDRPHVITSMGFQYMKKEVEFVIRPYPPIT